MSQSSGNQADCEDQVDGSFAGRTAIITGGGQGIGGALCDAFATAGANVVVADIDGSHARKVANELAGRGLSAHAVEVDVSGEPSVGALAVAAHDRFGSIDILVNNAAIFSTLERNPFTELSADEWMRVAAVNEVGPFLCAKHVVPVMRDREYGRIVNISSATVRSGSTGYLHYVSTKSALIGMTRALARELGPDGITVNAVLPGPVRTEVKRKWFKDESQFARAIEGQMVKRLATVEDICSAVTFLCSAESGFITAQCLAVDGGLTTCG